MARLSQKAWNNVIIFSMLIMITVLNLDRFGGGEDEGSTNILASGEIVLSLQVDLNVIERVGQSWRISPKSPAASENVSAEALANLVQNWQRAVVTEPIETIELDVFERPNHVVAIWLAGEPQSRVYPIVRNKDFVYIKVNNEGKLLDFPNLSQLVSW